MHYLAPIVEGHGEVEALPNLLHRIAALNGTHVQVNQPIRVKSGSFLNNDEYFSRQISLAAAKASEENGTVLILLDCDDGCPATLGPNLLQRARAVRDDIPIIVTLAYREFESWFLTAADSLRGVLGLPGDLETPAEIDRVRDAKGWLSERMEVNYDPISHQLVFCRKFDIEQARACHSFNRFYEKLCTIFDN
jgi:Domain of unknown function (DUF4276)